MRVLMNNDKPVPVESATVTQLCEDIYLIVSYLPAESWAPILRVHERIWQIVDLYDAGLITPKSAAKPRLLELWRAVDNARILAEQRAR